MAISTYVSYASKIASGVRVRASRQSTTVVQGRLYSSWLALPTAGTIPTTAAVPARNVAGAIGQLNGATALRLAQVDFSVQHGGGGTLILCDRLGHQGGLSGTTTGAQTTNLPTAALTRYTSGVGVFAGIEIYTAIGATNTELAISYTNTAGTAGRVPPTMSFGSTGFNGVGRFFRLPLVAGDLGVKSVESVTIAASTLTAGNFGVTLYTPVLWLTIPRDGECYVYDAVQSGDLFLPDLTDACLFWLYVTNSTASGLQAYELKFIED